MGTTAKTKPDPAYLTDITDARRQLDQSLAIVERNKLILIAAIQDAFKVGHQRNHIVEHTTPGDGVPGLSPSTVDKYRHLAPVTVPDAPTPATP